MFNLLFNFFFTYGQELLLMFAIIGPWRFVVVTSSGLVVQRTPRGADFWELGAGRCKINFSQAYLL
jgi:hypothetical protein